MKITRKILTITLAVMLALGYLPLVSFAVNPINVTVYVNGAAVAFEAYNIDNDNYFKLRDLAFAINGTEKQFSVGWDEGNSAITLTCEHPYDVVGGELESRGSDAKAPTPTNSKIYLDGQEIQLTAYNIDGNNYFKLRDIGMAVDFGIDWNFTENAAMIWTAVGYSTPD